MTCYLADSPHGCFQEHRRRLLKIRYPGELIPCQTCKSARINAELAHVPEDDSIDNTNMRQAEVDPADFLEDSMKPKEKRVREKMTCKEGHSRKVHGTKRKDGGWRCRLCVSAKKKAAYQRKKEANHDLHVL